MNFLDRPTVTVEQLFRSRPSKEGNTLLARAQFGADVPHRHLFQEECGLSVTSVVGSGGCTEWCETRCLSLSAWDHTRFSGCLHRLVPAPTSLALGVGRCSTALRSKQEKSVHRVITLVALAVLLISPAAEAVTIDFESLDFIGAGNTSVAGSYSEDGCRSI